MDLTATMDAPCPPARLFELVDDLGRYPAWFEIVPRAWPADRVAADPGPAWWVELRGRVGPLARSKRLRMVRTLHDPPHRARFERSEVDGRSHSPWLLDITVEPGEHAEGASGDRPHSRLAMDLHYGGAFWGSVLERLLQSEIEQSRRRLLRAVADLPT